MATVLAVSHSLAHRSQAIVIAGLGGWRLPPCSHASAVAEWRLHAYRIRGSFVVRISACHAEDPGSIPGRGVSCAPSWANFASACHASDLLASPALSPFFSSSPTARLAQSAERKALNLVVVGSSPTVGA